MLDYVGNGYNRVNLEAEIKGASASASGSLFSLPAGSLKLVFGGEYRHERFKRSDGTLQGEQEVSSFAGGTFGMSRGRHGRVR